MFAGLARIASYLIIFTSTTVLHRPIYIYSGTERTLRREIAADLGLFIQINTTQCVLFDYATTLNHCTLLRFVVNITTNIKIAAFIHTRNHVVYFDRIITIILTYFITFIIIIIDYYYGKLVFPLCFLKRA